MLGGIGGGPGSRFDAGRCIEGNGRGPLPAGRCPRAERGGCRSLSGRSRRSAFEFRSAGYSGSRWQAGGLCLPLREKIGDGVAGRSSRRLALRQAPCGRHAGLEGRGIADEGRRLIIAMTSMNKVFADLPVTVFEAMSQLARDNNAINLGQGFPDDPGPEDIRRAAAEAVMDGYNQYPSMMGIPELRQAIAAPFRRLHGLALRSITAV